MKLLISLLLISSILISCQAIQESSEKAFSNANSAIKSKVFIPADKKESEKEEEEAKK